MNNRYSFQDVVNMLANSTGKEKTQVEAFLRVLVRTVIDTAITDKAVQLEGIGTFRIITVEARESIHINTNERFVIPAHYKFSFIPDKELAAQVNKPFSFFETTEVKENIKFDDLEDRIEPMLGDEEENADSSTEEFFPEEKPIVEEEKPSEEEVIQAEESSDQEEVAEEKAEEIEEPITEDVIAEASVVQSVITENTCVAEEHKENIRTNRYLTIFIVIISILAVVNVGFYLNPDFFLKDQTPASLAPDTIQKPSVAQVEQEIIKLKDSVEVDKAKDTIAVTPQRLFVKITAGSRLTSLAKKYYGHKIFWVYIYEHNKNIIQNPNNIPIGTTIEIPPQSLYDININDSSSIGKASLKQTEILNRSYK